MGSGDNLISIVDSNNNLPKPKESQESLDSSDSLKTADSFERFRSKSDGALLRTPQKSLLKKCESPDSGKIQRRVSFADFNGRELEQIWIFDEPIFDDQADEDEVFLLKTDQIGRTRRRVVNERRFVPYFTLHWTGLGTHPALFSALEDRKICLESVKISSPWRIMGTILVKNLSFNKRVFVRQSLDKWQSQKDVDAEYVCSVNSDVDRFRFDLRFAFKMAAGTRLELVLGYELPELGKEFWDNNCNNNYAFWYNDKM